MLSGYMCRPDTYSGVVSLVQEEQTRAYTTLQEVVKRQTSFPLRQRYLLYNNESTAGADASMEVPKLHNVKLLIALYT